MTPIATVWWWADKDHDHITGALFNPFTNSADCAVVMDEVVKKGKGYIAGCDQWGNYTATVTFEGSLAKGVTECEAKMNAVLAMIEKGKEGK